MDDNPSTALFDDLSAALKLGRTMLNDLESAVADAREALGGEGDLITRGADTPPRYDLFHAANSICSQKVRCVLAHHRFPYRGHTLNLFKGDTYLPPYVRLRMAGCEAFGGALASHHSGATSVETGGCDGAVVPTLVDWEAGEVIIDSKRICILLDAHAPEADRLRPAALSSVIDDELAIIDNLPNYQMLMGRPRPTESAESTDETRAAFSRRKVAWCDRYLEESAGDETLVRAYLAKRAKELSAADELFSPEAMRAAYAMADVALADLEQKLAKRDGAWLFGDHLTLADLFWAIELLRMKEVGVAASWEDGRLPHVQRFASATEALPAIRSAITDWAGAKF